VVWQRVRNFRFEILFRARKRCYQK
jgi:hypothetical protein